MKFGRTRKKKLAKFTLVMLLINIFAFILGLLAALNFGRVPGQMIGIFLGMILLLGFSLAAYFLDFGRLYFYGLLVGLSPLGYVTHHGFPITFGTTSGLMILFGLVAFIRLLRNNPIPAENIPTESA